MVAAAGATAHEMTLQQPEGYDTRVSASGRRPSGGQIQRIGLARAMFGAPRILVLDEPNSNRDNAGTAVPNGAIRATKAEGRPVVIVAHRPAAIQECDVLLKLHGGMAKAFGPTREVLARVLRNHEQVAGAGTRRTGGMS